MPEGAARGWNVYKSDTNRMGVLLLCSIVHEWIKGALSFCSVLSVLYSSLVLCTVWNKQPRISHHY